MSELKQLLPVVPKYFKANLHTHSTITDGKFSPEELREMYKKQGYQILAITDHNVVVDHSALNEEDFLLLTGGEFGVSEPGQDALYKKSYHLNCISKHPDNNWQPLLPRKPREVTLPYLEKVDSPDALDFTDVKGDVCLNNVTFGYTEDKTVLKNVSVNAKKGQTVAIVGPTGAGKTTIINLLMRFYDQQSGEILMDGIPSSNIKRRDMRRAFTMVLQDTWLFCGTIYDNIVYGKEDATPEEVYAAAKSAKIDSYIESLPEGYNTVLSDDGINISKGQRQLITIARAFLSKAPILILDEATSNVDSRTEIQIQSAMTELMKNKTCFIIAHRLSTIQNADTILVVKDGAIIEQGNHEELLKNGGFYSSLYNSQFV